MFPVELIAELREYIVSFLGPWGIASLSLTCHQALEDVEAYSRRELDRIEREHDVDDTWRFRVGMQATQDAAARLSEQGENRQGALIPNNVSYRRMLRSAYQTYLYSFVTTPSREWGSYLALSMHPDGKHLLSGGHGGAGDPSIVRLWDLSTEECIRSFVGHVQYVDNVGFSGGHIVSSSSDGRFRIWSMDGVCHHVVDIFEGADDHNRSVTALATSHDSVYAMDSGGPIYAIETLSGTVRSMEQPWVDTTAAFDPGPEVVLHVCNNYLLHARGREDKNDNDIYQDIEGRRDEGIYVFDRDSMKLRSNLSGNYCSFASSSNGDIAAATFRGQIQVFQLREGYLVAHRSVSYPFYDTPDDTTVLHITGSRIFVKAGSDGIGSDHSRITVYNALNGSMERRLCHSTDEAETDTIHTPFAMASNESEVFVGFTIGDGAAHRDGRRRASCAIKAFLR